MHTLSCPLLLEPRFDQKIWGGRRLEAVLGKSLPTSDRYGESLESDVSSRVGNGRLAGMTIKELLDRDRTALLGELGQQASEPFGDFPLLAKFIDASDVLSVQVHPNDEEARPVGKRGKTEAWYVISAEPGATLITGLKPEVTVSDVEQAIHDVRLGELMIEQTVEAGDTLLVPAGTTHAIGAGVLLYEIQQASDVTYRMYDWGRLDDAGNPRTLHVAESLDVLKPESQARRVDPLEISPGRTVLTACRYFALERWSIGAESGALKLDGRSFRLVSNLGGSVMLRAGDQKVDLPAGWTALIPAAVESIQADGNADLLVSYVPDLRSDIIEPLRSSGHDEDRIAALAGDLDDLRTAIRPG